MLYIENMYRVLIYDVPFYYTYMIYMSMLRRMYSETEDSHMLVVHMRG